MTARDDANVLERKPYDEPQTWYFTFGFATLWRTPLGARRGNVWSPCSAVSGRSSTTRPTGIGMESRKRRNGDCIVSADGHDAIRLEAERG